MIGLDIGSTTVKAVVAENGKVLWQDYQRHNTKQAEMVLTYLARMEAECDIKAGVDRLFITGSGAGLIAPQLGGKMVQEVVAVAAAVEKFHPEVNFVSEIGGEDMKTLFFTPSGLGKSKQVYMQSACSGGTGTFIEKTARKLNIPTERLAQMGYAGYELHKISSKCGIFAETDANSLVKSGVPVEEIIASLFEAVVYQNLATLTKGNTPMPQVLLLGGPNLFFAGLQEAWRHHLGKLWSERKLALPDNATLESLILVPAEALYYACLGCIEIGLEEKPAVGIYSGSAKLQWWVDKGQWEEKEKEGAKGLVSSPADLASFMQHYASNNDRAPVETTALERDTPALVGCDFGSTTAKAVVLSADGKVLFSCLCAIGGQPDQGCQGAVPADTQSRLQKNRRPGDHRLWQGSAEKHRRCGCGSRRDGRACDCRVELLSRCRRDLRRGRLRRQDHDPAPGHGIRLPLEFAMLLRQRRIPARCSGTL